MYVSGGQLAQGYLRRTDLTSTRFVANPIGDGGSRLYRTGDLARRVGTDIEYIGRADAGPIAWLRIEFGEVEAGLLQRRRCRRRRGPHHRRAVRRHACRVRGAGRRRVSRH